jgi:uncharacterized protein YndB with AHSA1/START domain
MSDTTAEVSRTISARPDEVWQALTTPETLREFFFGAQDEKMRPLFEKDWAMVLDGLAKTVGR